MNAKIILVVDDDQVVANIYQDKFRAEGYEAELALDGPSALERLRQSPVDLVLLDLGLPGMNGVEILKHIRSHDETKAIPVIVFSNTYLSSLMQAAFKAGATKCLSKASCPPRDVLETVRKIFTAGQTATTPAATLPSGAAGAPSDTEYQAGLVAAFLASAPQTIAAMRNGYQCFLKPGPEKVRLDQLHELGRLTRSLTGAAGLVGFRKIPQLASALEAFLKELRDRPADITPSTIRTIAQAVDQLARLVTHASTLTGHAEKQPPLILVVDDDAVSREIIVRAISRAGLRAVSLDNSTLALHVLEQNRFDLIFLDIQMPKPDGLEVCERLRKMPLNRTTPVVFVTAQSDFESRVHSSSSGGNDFIAKPVLVLELAVKALTLLFADDLKLLGTAGMDTAGAKLKTPAPPIVPSPAPLVPRPLETSPGSGAVGPS